MVISLQEQLEEVEASTSDKNVYKAIVTVGVAIVAVWTALLALYPGDVVPTPVLVCVMVLLGIPAAAFGGVMPVLSLLHKYHLKKLTAKHVQELKQIELEQAHELKLAEAKALTGAGFEVADTINGVQLYKRKQ